MKIAILHSGDLNNVSPGGISQYIEKLIKYNEEDKITIFGTVESNSNYKIMNEYVKEVSGKKFTFIPISNNKKRPLSIYYFLKLIRIKKKLKDYDIIYAQRMEYVLPFIFSSMRKKVVFAIHGSGRYATIFWGKFIGSIYYIMESIALRVSNKVIVLLKRDEYGVPYYRKRMKNNSEKIKYGKVPIDLDCFYSIDKSKVRNELGFDDNDNIVIYFGRIDNNPKRILLLPKIAKELNKKVKNIKFIVIGNGNDKENLIGDINRLGLEDIFIIKDKMNHGEELVKYINLADISIILSNFEGICMSALESIACGVPVIATDVGDIKEYISNNINGIILENNISEEKLVLNFSEAIQNLLKNKVNINNVYKNYEGKRVVEELRCIFNSMIGEK